MIHINDYINYVTKTNQIDSKEDILLGLIGEIGSLMSPAKKLSRENEAYTQDKFRKDTLEELGDIFWYFTALSIELGWELDTLLFKLNLEDSSEVNTKSNMFLTTVPEHPVILRKTYSNDEGNKNKLIDFAMQGYDFINSLRYSSNIDEKNIMDFLKNFQEILIIFDTSFSEIASLNIEKISSRFLGGNEPEDFDIGFDSDEQLPDEFEIDVVVKNNKTYMKWNGVRIGDPLSDNNINKDGYRYHDVFHLAYVAILHWSPVIRALIKHKRKSQPSIDEAQDGGRAIVIEEGLTVWLYSQAKEHNYFKDSKNLSYDILKTIQQFVKGYEVERCSLKLWEKAILDGYKVFNQLREAGQGKIIGNRKKRTIEYQSFS